MQTFNLFLTLDGEYYSNISLKAALVYLAEYFADYGENEDYTLTYSETGELILMDTLFTNGNSKIKFRDLYELLPYWNRIPPVIFE